MDAKLEQACNHNVSGTLYTITNCPRCLGTGSYWDIAYDNVGRLATVSNAPKLKQDILKIVQTSSNPFHGDYSSQLKLRLGGTYDSDTAKTTVESDLRQTISSFRSFQGDEPTITDSERIAEVTSITTWIQTNEPRKVYASVVLQTASAKTVKLNTTVQL